jgi:FKBP-type peptidyl-prolyl cis-trans isomerase FkpA
MKLLSYFILSFILASSCKNNKTKEKTDQAEINERLTNMNKYIVQKESKRIDEFIAAHGFNTQRTGTGLRYEVYSHGSGEHPGMRSVVEIKYKVFLLDGTLCYTTDSLGMEKLRLGIGDQVRGLEEGVMLMVPGDKARLILPAHLGYGMAGDQNKIPPASALFYDVELIAIVK